MNIKAKFTTDRINYAFPFSHSLQDGDSIVSAEVTGDVGLTVEPTIINDDGVPTAFVSGGVDGRSYAVSCKIFAASGEVLNSQFILEIRACR